MKWKPKKKKKRKKKKLFDMAIMWLNWRIEITNVTLQLLNIYRFEFSSFFEAEIGLLNFLFYDIVYQTSYMIGCHFLVHISIDRGLEFVIKETMHLS